MQNVTELPSEWIVVPMANARSVGCCGRPALLHSLKIGDWWLQIQEDRHGDSSESYVQSFPPAQHSAMDWSILYKESIATSGVSNLSLTKTKVMLKIVFEQIKDSPPPEEKHAYMGPGFLVPE